MPLDLPASVLSRVEFSPSEDMLLAVLREGLPDLRIYSLIPEDSIFPFVLVRRVPGFGPWDGDSRFIDKARFAIHSYTSDPDGDEKGAVVQEAVRVVLREAWLSNKTVPGLGSVVRIDLEAEPTRKTDWATSSGPVQFADLPTGTWRYEAQYSITVRKPR